MTMIGHQISRMISLSGVPDMPEVMNRHMPNGGVDRPTIMLKQMMTGWIMFTIQPMIYVEMAVLGFMSYVVVSILEMKKSRNIPMDQALKNVE